MKCHVDKKKLGKNLLAFTKYVPSKCVLKKLQLAKHVCA